MTLGQHDDELLRAAGFTWEARLDRFGAAPRETKEEASQLRKLDRLAA